MYKTFSLFALAIFSFLTFTAQSQSCTSGCTQTITVAGASSTGYNANNNDVVCITGNGTYNGTINMNGSNVTICLDENITLTSTLGMNSSTTINNYGEINIASGTWSLDGTLNNFGTLHASGLTLNSSGVLNNQGDSMYVGSLTIDGDATIIGDARAGTVAINGSGTLNLQDGILTVDGSFRNDGTVSAAGSSNCAGINASGATVNQGNYGVDGSPLDFCDPDGSFDVQNGTVGAGVTACNCPPGATLPVELVYFKASKLENKNILKWKTASELNNSHFIVEKSTNGFSFIPIGQIEGKGTAKFTSEYSFNDLETQQSISYYRLKQVDYDGTYTYSRTILIEREISADVTVKHKPSENTISINYTTEKELLGYQLFSLDGKSIPCRGVEANKTITISTDKLHPGLYILQYSIGTKKKATKILIQ